MADNIKTVVDVKTLSFKERRELVEKALNARFGVTQDMPRSVWVRDMWETECIYSFGPDLFKVTYSFDENGVVTLGEPAAVTEKTVYVTQEAAQEVLARIVQETARHFVSENDVVENSQFSLASIRESLTELLAGEKPEDLTETRLSDARRCLAWLENSQLAKIEESAKYPVEAFALVADKTKPESWSLRIWETREKGCTKSQLDKAAAYFSPGGYRGQHIEMSVKEAADAKRIIRSAYRKLNVSDDDMSKWVKESETRQLVANYLPLSEAAASVNGKGTLTIIKAGFNTSGERYYPKETLARDKDIFSGLKMYADHPTNAEESARPERSIKDWVASLGDVTVNKEGNLEASYQVVEPWFEQKLASLKSKGLLNQIGVSINAIGQATESEIDGRKTKVIERFVRARSVDFVTEPGAGGGVNVFESLDPNIDIDLIDVSVLRERRPDVVKMIESECETKITKEVKARMEEVTELKNKLTEMTEAVKTLTQEKANLESKIAEAETAKAFAAAQSQIKETVAKAALPEVAKQRVLALFEKAVSVEGLDAAIEAETKYIASVKESGKVKNLGPNAESSKKDVDAKNALKESFKALTGGDEKKAAIAAEGK